MTLLIKALNFKVTGSIVALNFGVTRLIMSPNFRVTCSITSPNFRVTGLITSPNVEVEWYDWSHHHDQWLHAEFRTTVRCMWTLKRWAILAWHMYLEKKALLYIPYMILKPYLCPPWPTLFFSSIGALEMAMSVGLSVGLSVGRSVWFSFLAAFSACSGSF